MLREALYSTLWSLALHTYGLLFILQCWHPLYQASPLAPTFCLSGRLPEVINCPNGGAKYISPFPSVVLIQHALEEFLVLEHRALPCSCFY